MSSSYQFLPWLRQGLATRLPAATSGAGRASLSLAATFTATGASVPQQTLTLPPVQLLGPGDVTGLDARQIVRTDPVDGATGFELDHYPTVDLGSPVLPWLFTPLAPTANRIQPWLCLVVVRVQDGVRRTVDTARHLTVLEIDTPADARTELPNLADAWAFAHVQISGTIAAPDTIGTILANQPQRVVSRLLCPTPLRPDSRYWACVVPTFAAGRAAGLGLPVPSGLGPAWTPADKAVTLPVYFTWEFSTGDGGDFAALAGALRYGQAPAGTGARPMQIAGYGLTAPAGTPDTLTFTGALCAPGTPHPPAPTWVRQALAPLVGTASGIDAPLYGGEQAGARTVAATDTGWLAELNLDPRLRAVAALGAAVIDDQQESLVSAAWTQAGQIQDANTLIGGGQVARAVGGSLHDRHLAVLPAGTLAQVSAPLQATASADVAGTTAYRRVTRARGPLARRAQPDTPPAVTPGDAAALMAAIDPATAVANRLRDRITVPGAGTAPTTALTVSPTFPAPMFGALATLAPQLLMPGADGLPADSIVLLETNPRFVAAFLAGLNTQIVRELRFRGFPIDATGTAFQHFWDWRGSGAASPPVDIAPMAGWPATAGLDQVVTGAGAGAQIVLAVRGELLRRQPRTAVYAVRAATATTLADETVPGNVAYPLFSGSIDPDIRFFGFPLTVAQATGGPTSGAGYFLVFQEQPTETRFGPPADGSAPQAGATTTAADVAQRTMHPPMRVAVHASRLLTAQGATS